MTYVFTLVDNYLGFITLYVGEGYLNQINMLVICLYEFSWVDIYSKIIVFYLQWH